MIKDMLLIFKAAIECLKLEIKYAIKYTKLPVSVVITDAKTLNVSANDSLKIEGRSNKFTYQGKVDGDSIPSMSIDFTTQIGGLLNQSDPLQILNAGVQRGNTKRIGILVVELDQYGLSTYWASSQNVDHFLLPIEPIDTSKNIGICPRCRFKGVFPVTPEQCEQESADTQQSSEGSNELK